MSAEDTTPSPLPRVLDTEWEALIKRGTAQGSLTIDDVVQIGRASCRERV